MEEFIMKNIKRKFMAFLLTLTMLVTTSTVAMAAEVEPLNDTCGEEVTHMFDGKNVQVLKEIEVAINEEGIVTYSGEIGDPVVLNLSNTASTTFTKNFGTKYENVYAIFVGKLKNGNKSSGHFTLNFNGKSISMTADGNGYHYYVGTVNKGNHTGKVTYIGGTKGEYLGVIQFVVTK